MGLMTARAIVLGCGLWITLIALVLSIPHEDTQAQDFLNALENCGGHCIFNIQPGRTRIRDALQYLHTQPWVRDIVENATGNGYSTISWEWNGKQPPTIDANRQGRITFYWVSEDVVALDDSLVETITIYTNVRHFSLQNWLGVSTGGSATIRPDGKLGYTVVYDMPGGTLNLYVEVPCPLNLITYWNARTRLTLSIGQSPDGNVHPAQLAKVCQLSRQ